MARAALALLTALVLAWAGTARAGTVIQDPYGVGAPDVLGDPNNSDIESFSLLELTRSEITMQIRMNYYGGDTTLSQFPVPGASYTAPVGVGDVLIQGQSHLWAIPLSNTGSLGGIGGGIYLSLGAPVPTADPVSRDTLLKGSIYLVTNTISAGQALGAAPADDLRADVPVWGELTDFNPSYGGLFPQVTSLGGSEIAITLKLTTLDPVVDRYGFYDDVVNGFDVHFASTTCACDVLDGHITVPEPRPLALTALALTLLFAGSRLCFRAGGGT
jgi:hypothetical protein